MNLWFRLFWLFLKHLIHRRGMTPTETGRITLRVLPSDLDANLHMTNSRFFSVFDLGRMDLMFRSGLFGVSIKKRWSPVVAGCDVRFRRALRPFERFWVESRVAGWDDRWLYMEQQIHTKRGIAASALVRGVTLDGSKVLSPAEMLSHIDVGPDSPPLPANFKAWRDSEADFHET